MHGEAVALDDGARRRMERARAVVERSVARGDAVYGLTTGVGVQKRFSVSPADEAWFNRRLIDNHRIGVGPPAPPEAVRAALLRLLNGLAAGFPGVRPEVADRVVALLNHGPLPSVHLLGSLGQADLAANADVALVVFDGFDPAPGEVLAVLNNNAFSTGLAALAFDDALRLVDAAAAIGALALEAFAANAAALDPAVAGARPYPGLGDALQTLRRLLDGSYVLKAGAARNLQDPLTFRNMASQQGAARDALAHVARGARRRAQRGAEQPSGARRRRPHHLGERLRGPAARGRDRLRPDRPRAAAHERRGADPQAARPPLVGSWPPALRPSRARWRAVSHTTPSVRRR